jgi:peptidyl-prolyl cis-trans isomerase SurA
MPPEPVLSRQVLDRLVVQRLQLQRADKVGIKVSDETLNQALATVAQRNNVTLEQLPDLLAREGIDYAAYREELRQQVAIDQLRQRDVLQRISVTPKEIEAYLARQQGKPDQRAEYKLSHILIAVPASASPAEVEAAEQRIDDIAARVKSGEDFAKLAVTYSNGQQALDGGSLGWLKGAELPSLFADVVPGLAPGQVSEPLRNSSGFHLIRLDDERGASSVMEDQTRARHILIETNEVVDDGAAQQELLAIRQRILAGEDFAAVAKAVSDDPQSALEGGDLGWNGPGSFVPEFEKVMNSLKIGEISEPFRTQFGWHLLQV